MKESKARYWDCRRRKETGAHPRDDAHGKKASTLWARWKDVDCIICAKKNVDATWFMRDLTDSLIKKLNHSQHNAILSHIIKLILFFAIVLVTPDSSSTSFVPTFFLLVSFHYVSYFFFLLFNKLLLNCCYCSPNDVTKNKLYFRETPLMFL